MVRDYSKFLSGVSSDQEIAAARDGLADLGWQPFFAQQIDAEEFSNCPPARVTAVQEVVFRSLGKVSLR